MVIGEREPLYGADNICDAVWRIPGAELALLPNGGHAVVQQQTRAFE